MSMISISNLSDGSTLLTDAESFLTDLSDAELQISGGGGCGKGSKGKGSKGSKKSKSKKSKSKSKSRGGCYFYCH